MKVVVFLGKSQAMVSGCDEYGLLFVDVPMDRLSQRQRETLATMTSSVIWHDYGYGHCRLETSDGVNYYQEFAPYVQFSGVAGVMDAIDAALLDYQRRVYQEKVRVREDAAKKAELEAKELAEARKWSRRFSMRKDEESESWLCGLNHYALDTEVECSFCGQGFNVKGIRPTMMSQLLTESVQESIKELALDLRWERMVCAFDRHLAGCRAKAIAKARQDAELQTLFIKSANDEEKERALAGFMSPKEMRKIVTDYLFRPVRVLADEAEDYREYGNIATVALARRIKYSDIAHEEPCEYLNDNPMEYRVAKARYLTPERFQFFRLVKAAYRGPSDFTASQEARYLCCYCTRCERKMVGFHVLVTLTSPAGQEFSRRFEPAQPRWALFFDNTIFNTHWES